MTHRDFDKIYSKSRRRAPAECAERIVAITTSQKTSTLILLALQIAASAQYSTHHRCSFKQFKRQWRVFAQTFLLSDRSV